MTLEDDLKCCLGDFRSLVSIESKIARPISFLLAPHVYFHFLKRDLQVYSCMFLNMGLFNFMLSIIQRKPDIVKSTATLAFCKGLKVFSWGPGFPGPAFCP